jgi:hypothetical protein
MDNFDPIDQLSVSIYTFDINIKQIQWLIDYLRFYVPLKNFSLTWRRHHCRWRAPKFRPMLGAQGLWAGRDLYRATPAVKRDLGFSDLIQRTAPISRILRHTWGCGGSILTRILTETNAMKNNAVIVHWNVPKFSIFARAHVHARAGQLFWPCSSVGDFNIYLQWIWTKIKEISFARFYVQK